MSQICLSGGQANLNIPPPGEDLGSPTALPQILPPEGEVAARSADGGVFAASMSGTEVEKSGNGPTHIFYKRMAREAPKEHKLVSNFISSLWTKMSGAPRAGFRLADPRRNADPQLSRHELRRAVADMVD